MFMLHIFIKIEQEFYTEALDLCVQAVEKFPNFEEKLIVSLNQHQKASWCKQFCQDVNIKRKDFAEKVCKFYNQLFTEKKEE